MAAAMPLLPPLLLLALLGAFAARAQDFDLSDALDDPKKPLPTPKKPSGGGAGDDLDLSDALGGHDPQPPPPRPPPPRPRDPQKPDPKPAGGDFSNSDLEDAAGGRGPGRGGEGPRSGEPDPEGPAPGLVPGLVAAALAALAGGVSSFVAYQKRRLCFRDAGPAPV